MLQKTFIALCACCTAYCVSANTGVAKPAPWTAYTVEDKPGYNSWPMMQAIGKRLVCAYSSGSGHSIGEGSRDVFSRYSDDGGKTWSAPVCVASSPTHGEVTIGKGLDKDGAMLLWVRCVGKPWHHDLYRTTDGVKFTLLASPKLDPMPMQITDVFEVSEVGLMSLWFAGRYDDKPVNSWGTLVSKDNGKTWTQQVVEKGLPKKDWPTEPSAVYLGNGRILAIARTETGPSQFQLTSTDYGKTWKKQRTNISDICISTPSLIYDKNTGLLSNYYYWRGHKVVNRRVVKPDAVFDDPDKWPAPHVVGLGNEERSYDAGNVNATVVGDQHYITYYSGSKTDSGVYVAPARKQP